MTSTIDNIYIDNDCKHGDNVQYRVRAVAKDGRCSSWSLPASILVGDLTPPPDPVNFNVTSGYAGCLLTWLFPVEDETYKHTEIFRQTRSSGDSAYYDGVIVSSIESTDFRLVGTYRAEEAFICGDFNADYCFKIRHVDNSGNKSNFSTVLCATTRGIKPIDIDQTPNVPRIYYTPMPNYIPATDVYVNKYWDSTPTVTLPDALKKVDSDLNDGRMAIASTQIQLTKIYNDFDNFKKAVGTQFQETNQAIELEKLRTQEATDELWKANNDFAKSLNDNFVNDDVQRKLSTSIKILQEQQGQEIENLKPIIDSANKAIQSNNDKDATRDNIIEALKNTVDANKSVSDTEREAAKNALDQFKNATNNRLNSFDNDNANFKDALAALKKVDEAQQNANNDLKQATTALGAALRNNELGDKERESILKSALQELDKLKLKDQELSTITATNEKVIGELATGLNLAQSKIEQVGQNLVLEKSKIDQVGIDLAIETAKMEEIRARLDNGIADINTLTQGLNLSNNEIAAIRRALTDAKAQLEEIKTRLNNGIADINSLRSGLNLSNNDIAVLKKALDDAKTQAEEIASRVTQNTNRIDASEREITKLNNDVNINKNELANLSSIVSTLKQTQVDQSLKTGQQGELIKELGDKLEQLKTKQAQDDSQNKDRDAELENKIRIYNDALNLAKKSLEDDLAILRNQVAGIDDKINSYIQSNNEWKTNADLNFAKKSDLEALKIQLGNLVTKPEFQAQINEILAKYDKQLNDLGLQSQNLEAKLTGLIGNVDNKINTEIAKLITQNDSLWAAWQANNNLDVQQQLIINNHEARISNLEAQNSNINAKLSKAVSRVNVSTLEGTLQGTLSNVVNVDGMKSVTLDIDVNSQGLVRQMQNNFVIKQGVSTSVSGQIINQQ